MSRPLRIEYPDAWYHVMNCRRRGEDSFTGKNGFDTLKGVGKVFGLDKNSMVGSVVERVTREMVGMGVGQVNCVEILDIS